MAILVVTYLVSLVSFFCGVLAFISVRKHLLSTLLSLEFIMLSIFWFMSSVVVNLGGDCYFLLFFLTLAACEGALGLSLLVSIVRSHGNDNFSSFNTLQC
uniref:NADH-ubiquinone oxidoreductase chain 4L n=1 Tax=Chlorotocus crassicornis TaxID=1073559 RepID=A0A343J2P1_9EUCA|nr:NADH dehydrogenase subunit 4L [Chlorotocus crassicornis]ASU92683.1 NADH dehydrogenase subunit 4L [Chlorotocus crassicornis]